jgi:hypothetical protein
VLLVVGEAVVVALAVGVRVGVMLPVGEGEGVALTAVLMNPPTATQVEAPVSRAPAVEKRLLAGFSRDSCAWLAGVKSGMPVARRAGRLTSRGLVDAGAISAPTSLRMFTLASATPSAPVAEVVALKVPTAQAPVPVLSARVLLKFSCDCRVNCNAPLCRGALGSQLGR